MERFLRVKVVKLAGMWPKRATAAVAIFILALATAQFFGTRASPTASLSTTSTTSLSLSRITRTVIVSPKGGNAIAGIGASGAWWSSPIYQMGPFVRNEVGQLLFSQSGLHLSQFRFNIGGGGVGVTTPWKAPPSFLAANGTINLAKDQSGLYFLEQANSYGVKSLVGFANSAPAQFVSNHKSCGGYLPANQVAGYANFLTNVVVAIHQRLGIKLGYISPMNEPAGSQRSCRQEGMKVRLPQRAELVIALGRDLAKRAPWCKVIADESSTISTQMNRELLKWADNPKVLKYLAVVAHHGYDFPSDATFSKFAALVAKLHKPSWSTEICCNNGAGFAYQYDPTMDSGMWLANYIYQQFVYAKDSAFDWWTALSPDLGCDPKNTPGCFEQINPLGRNDGLIYYDLSGAQNRDLRLYTTKRYFVMGNFSKVFRPGYVIHLTSGYQNGIRALSAVYKNHWSVVILDNRNFGSRPIKVVVTLPLKKGARVTSVSGFITSDSSSWAAADRLTHKSHTFTTVVTDQSVSSFEARVS